MAFCREALSVAKATSVHNALLGASQAPSAVVLLTVAIRTECNCVLNRVIAAVGKAYTMVHLKVGSSIRCSLERRRGTTMFAGSCCSDQYFGNNVRIALE